MTRISSRFFFGVSFVGSLWFYFGWKTVLTDEAIEHSMWPLPTLRYSLRDAESVRRTPTLSVTFAGHRKFGVLPFASGSKFLSNHLKRVSEG